MAYVGANLSMLMETIEGSFSTFVYVTSDTIAQVLAAGYFSDGVERGMSVGDVVFASVGGVPYLLYVASSSHGACSVSPYTLAILNGNGFPTSQPPLGSGLLWNNGGFVCVA